MLRTIDDLILKINKNDTIELEILPLTIQDSSEILGYVWISGDIESAQFDTLAEALYDYLDSIKNWNSIKIHNPNEQEDEQENDEF